MFLNYF